MFPPALVIACTLHFFALRKGGKRRRAQRGGYGPLLYNTLGGKQSLLSPALSLSVVPITWGTREALCMQIQYTLHVIAAAPARPPTSTLKLTATRNLDELSKSSFEEKERESSISGTRTFCEILRNERRRTRHGSAVAVHGWRSRVFRAAPPRQVRPNPTMHRRRRRRPPPRGEPANGRARMKLDHKSFALSSRHRTNEGGGKGVVVVASSLQQSPTRDDGGLIFPEVAGRPR